MPFRIEKSIRGKFFALPCPEVRKGRIPGFLLCLGTGQNKVLDQDCSLMVSSRYRRILNDPLVEQI